MAVIAGTTPEPEVSSAVSDQPARRGIAAFMRYLVRRNRLGLVALFVLVLLCAIAIFASAVAPYNPQLPSALSFAGPSLSHLMGTDEFGRDILSRTIYGARISLTVGLLSALLGGAIGAGLGLVAAMSRGVVEQGIMRFMDVLLAFPFILLAILILAFFGQGVVNVILAISVARVPNFARLAHSSAVSLREREYVNAARSGGASNGYIVRVHLLPNILQQLTVYATFSIPIAILIEAGLDYIGVGVNPSTATWGAIINQGQQSILLQPWQVIGPGLAIMLTVLAFNLFGEAVSDFLDPQHSVGVAI